MWYVYLKEYILMNCQSNLFNIKFSDQFIKDWKAESKIIFIVISHPRWLYKCSLIFCVGLRTMKSTFAFGGSF